ncbi:hypothetical protein [Flavobacterium sp. UBA4197]|uniref:hypothetical protein n=1 Tax=Flavobacterium sp. UBA4197 TaxID=1946546 RepID=UPI00257F8898|nr:hypothetical protein [Flavobacterium sp. UBA4197]
MKHSEIKTIYNLYLKDKMPTDYILKGDILYKKPIDSLLVGFCFERSGLNSNGFYLNAFVQPLYVPSEDISLTFGYRVTNTVSDFWEINPESENRLLFSSLEMEMNRSIDTFLSIFNSPTSFYKYYEDKCVNLRMVQAVVLSSCYDLLDERFELMTKYISILEEEDMSINWKRNIFEQAKLLRDQISNKNELHNILFGWKNETIRHLKLDC